MTPVSVELVEQFFARKIDQVCEMTAREADAFVILERELRTEANG